MHSLIYDGATSSSSYVAASFIHLENVKAYEKFRFWRLFEFILDFSKHNYVKTKYNHIWPSLIISKYAKYFKILLLKEFVYLTFSESQDYINSGVKQQNDE